MLVIDTLLSRTTRSIRATLRLTTLELVLRQTARVILRANIRVKTRVVGVIKAALRQVPALGLLIPKVTRHVSDIRRRLAAVVLAVVAAAAGGGLGMRRLLLGGSVRALALGLLRARRTAGISALGQVGAGEVALAAESVGVLFLPGDVLALGADGGGGELRGGGGVGRVQGGLASSHAEGLGAPVLGEGTACHGRLGGERVAGHGAGGFGDGVAGGFGVVGDLYPVSICAV